MRSNAIASRSRIPVTYFLQVVTAILWTGLPGYCQTVINIPPDLSPPSIGSHTTVNLLDSGVITVSPYESFIVGSFDGTSTNAVLNIEGGQFEAKGIATSLRIEHGGTMNLHSGEIVGQIGAAGGKVNIYDGHVGPGGFSGGIYAGEGGAVSITGGIADTTVSSQLDGEVFIAGGSVGNVQSRDNGRVRLSGGTIGSIGNGESGTSILVQGGEYRLNGVPIPDLVDVGSSQQVDIPDGATLTGVLQDGSPFAFADAIDTYIDQGVLTLETVSLPPIGPPVIQASTDVIPYGIRNGQTLIVDDGGVVPKRFTAIAGSTMLEVTLVAVLH